MSKPSVLDQIFEWRRKRLSERTFILIASSLVGIVAGLAAVLLKMTVHFVHHEMTSARYDENYFQLLYPVIGLLLTVLLAKVLYKETSVGHAISDILYSISRKQSIVAQGKMYSRWITSVITVGFGGSVGLESPIVLTGGAIGSNIGEALRLDYKSRTLLLGCGVGGAIAAIFNAPIAGLIFAIEVILTGVSVSNFIPLLIACVSATIISKLTVGDEILFTFNIVDAIKAEHLPFYVILGIVCGVTALYFNRMLHWAEHFVSKRNQNPYVIAILGGMFLSVLIFLTPPVYGEGYISIENILHGRSTELLSRSHIFGGLLQDGWLFLLYIVILIIMKIIATSVTLSSGGSGGTFAPSMVLGGLAGFATGRFINLAGFADVSEVNFTLVGMSGVMCGIQYAPLTAIFLIAEITGGYTLFVPLMLVAAISYVTVTFFEPDSPHIRALKERGEYVHEADEDTKVLERLNINKLIETDLVTVPHEGVLEDLVEAISRSKRNIFPVVDAEGKLKGLVTLDDVRAVMFDVEKHQEVKIASLKQEPAELVYYGERMRDVMMKFEQTDAWNLPVVDAEGKYVGIVSKSRIFGVYRKQLIRLQKDWINS
ncbi:chloride channel protein [Limibacter armeniacum]|uniref:chloride channel protein n=1 Tax=Limibacter armeniacum TaxID=466084 RepID=UPI002FE624B8